MPAIDSSNETVRIRDAPKIPGLSFRRFRGEADFKILAEVIQKSRDADLYEWVETPEDIADNFHHLQNCDPHDDMLFVEIDGTTVGYCCCEWHDRPGSVRTYEHVEHLVPEWRKEGLRRAMLRQNERRLREVAEEHPKELAKFFEVRSNSQKNDWKSLLEQEGYRPFRHNLIMVRPNLDDTPDLPLPQGLEIRTAEREHGPIIFKAAEEAFRDEPNFNEEMFTEEGMTYFLESRMCEQPELWQVAWEGNEVAGASINFIDHEENEKFNRRWGWMLSIFVRRPYRNRGLASALTARSFEAFKREGMTSAILMVDFENPSGARRLYEKMGFRPHSPYTRYRKPLHD